MNPVATSARRSVVFDLEKRGAVWALHTDITIGIFKGFNLNAFF